MSFRKNQDPHTKQLQSSEKKTSNETFQTHPVSPITRIITIRLAVKILHLAGDQSWIVFIPKLQPLPRMFVVISIINH